MKSKQTTIPLKQRKEMAEKPFYKNCALQGYFNHVCEGKGLTWEHAIIHRGKKCQAEWSIVPLCPKAHAVNEFQDAGTMIKERNEWIAYCRATDEDILTMTGDMPGTDPNLSKARIHFQKKKYLIGKYGVWKPLDASGTYPGAIETVGQAQKIVKNLKKYIPSGEAPILFIPENSINKRDQWFKVPNHIKPMLKKLIELYEDQEKFYTPFQMIEKSVEVHYEALIQKDDR